jgi:hypothetical protein
MEGSGRLPDFYLLGHGKSGTSALYTMLARHPQVFVGLKEPRFFAEEMHENDIPRPGGTPRTLEEYKAWFARASPEQTVGDISPWYLWSKDAARRIAEVTPDAKLIAILREPTSFLLSLHRQWLQFYIESETDFQRAIELEPARREGRETPVNGYWPKALFYSDHVRYVEQLERYRSRFPPENMMLLIYDDYRRDNEGTLRSVLRFIGVDENPEIPMREVNPSVQVRSPRLNDVLRRVIVPEGPAARSLKSAITTLTPMRVRQRMLHKTRRRFVLGEPEPPDPEFMTELKRRLKPQVAAASDYLGRDLVALWGYDAL